MSNFILDVNAYRKSAKQMNSFCAGMDQKIIQYRQIIQKILQEGVSMGATHDALECYLSYVEPLEGQFLSLGKAYESIIDNFISEVKAADKLRGEAFLYEDGVSLRDYSDDMRQQLIGCLDDPWCELTDSFGDWIVGNLIKIADFFHIDFVRTIFGKNHEVLLDHLDATQADVNALFRAEQELDTKYKGQLNTFFLAYWSALETIRGLSRIMTPLYAGTSNFSVSQIDAIMGGKYKDLDKNMKKLEALPQYNAPASVEQIGNFATAQNGSYFLDAMSAGGDFTQGLGFWSGAGMTIFQMFEMARSNIKDWATDPDTWNAAAKNPLLLLNPATVPGFLLGERITADWKAASDGDLTTYNQAMVKKELMAVIEQELKKDPYSEHDVGDALGEMKDFTKLSKKYGKELYDYLNTHRIEEGGRLLLDGRTKEAKKFREMLDGFDSAGKILKYGDKGLELLSRAMTDYSQGLEVLDSLAANYPEDGMMRQAIEEIRAEYAKEFGSILDNVADIAADIGMDAAEKALTENPVGKVLEAIELGIDTVGETTGAGTKSKAAYNALVHFNMSTELNGAYESAVQDFQQAISNGLDPASEEYKAYADNVKNCFTLNKNNTIKMFNEMAEASSGAEKSYYTYCSRQASTMDLKDPNPPQIMSFEAYQKLYF